MAESPFMALQQRERPGYFARPSTPPRDIRSLSEQEVNDYLRGFYFNPRIGGATTSPYSAQDLRLELARRASATRRPDDGLEDGRNQSPSSSEEPITHLPPVPPPPPSASDRRPAARPQTESPETLDALQQFQAAYRNRLGMTAAAPTARPETTSSFLDLLRERTAENMRRERVQRLSDFGAGIAASGSPNLFAALAAGSRAQAEGERTRMDDLRRVAEAERQQRAQQAEEEFRREQNRIQAERFEAERPLREAQALQARSMAGFYAAGGSGAGRGQITPARLADLTLRAEAQALRDIPEPAANTTQALRDTPAEKTAREQRRRDRARELLAQSISTPEERAASGTVNTTPAPNQQQGRPVIRETFVPPEARR